MRRHMKRHVIVRVVAKLVIPFILLFALYVQFHGDYGPGGGFQAGVIFAAGVILYILVFGFLGTRRLWGRGFLERMLGAGVLLYGATGVVCLLRGGRFLEYNVLLSDPVEAQHLGILLVELGVGITVTAAMIAIFLTFVERTPS